MTKIIRTPSSTGVLAVDTSTPARLRVQSAVRIAAGISVRFQARNLGRMANLRSRPTVAASPRGVRRSSPATPTGVISVSGRSIRSTNLQTTTVSQSVQTVVLTRTTSTTSLTRHDRRSSTGRSTRKNRRPQQHAIVGPSTSSRLTAHSSYSHSRRTRRSAGRTTTSKTAGPTGRYSTTSTSKRHGRRPRRSTTQVPIGAPSPATIVVPTPSCSPVRVGS